jgi:hypothetical protein
MIVSARVKALAGRQQVKKDVDRIREVIMAPAVQGLPWLFTLSNGRGTTTYSLSF